LERFKHREGHCSVPEKHNENGQKLGLWVSNQRKRSDRLSVERMQRLDQLGFIWKSGSNRTY
jgi:hypothetical protein